MKSVLKVYNSAQEAHEEKIKLYRLLCESGHKAVVSGNYIILDVDLLQYKFISMEDPGRLRGLRYDLAIVDEEVSLTRYDKDDLVFGKINSKLVKEFKL